METSDVAAWVQAFGSIVAIWAAGRVAVLQQRLAREQAVEGIYGALSLGSQAMDDAASAARDSLWVNFDPDRLTDASNWLTNSSPAEIGNLLLTETVGQMLPLLRSSDRISRAVILQLAQGRGVGAGAWEPLRENADRSVAIVISAARILERAQSRTKQWWIW